MMLTAIIRANTDDPGVTLYWHQDELPAHRYEGYADEEQARADYPEYAWQAPDAAADRDVLLVAVVSHSTGG